MDVPESKTTFFFKLLIQTAQHNLPKEKNGYRFDTVMIMFAAYLKLIAGLLGKVHTFLIQKYKNKK